MGFYYPTRRDYVLFFTETSAREAKMTGIQLSLPMPRPPFPVLNLTGMVLRLMEDGAWWAPYQLQHAIEVKTGEWHSDASITARIRDGRKAPYGGHSIEKRIKEGSRAYEYRLVR